MKKLIACVLLAMSIACVGFGETIHLKKGYILHKYSDGTITKVRVLEEDGYHDWYIIGKEGSHSFYGYEDDDSEIIIDELIDIAIVD